MQLGATKTPLSLSAKITADDDDWGASPTAGRKDAWGDDADDAEAADDDVGDAWAENDLMDVNADADDWCEWRCGSAVCMGTDFGGQLHSSLPRYPMPSTTLVIHGLMPRHLLLPLPALPLPPSPQQSQSRNPYRLSQRRRHLWRHP